MRRRTSPRAGGFNRLYTRHFLGTLGFTTRPARSCGIIERLFDREAMLRSRNLYEFDNIVNAPLLAAPEHRRLLAARLEQSYLKGHRFRPS